MAEVKQQVKPETEQKLSILQDEYLKNRSVETYQELFSILHSYSRSLILKKTKGKIFLPKDLVDNATLEACVKFMQQYEKPSFKIDTSFGGLLNLKILESLYGPKIQRDDKVASLSAHVDIAHKKEIELGDMPETLKFSYLFRPDLYKENADPMVTTHYKSENIIKCLMTVFDKMYIEEFLQDYVLLNMAVIQFFRKNKKYEKFKAYYLSKPLQIKLEDYLSQIRQRLVEYA